MTDPRSVDPRQTGAIQETESDIRPSVALPGQGLPNWLIAVGMVALALLLFAVLEVRRHAASEPAASTSGADTVRTATAAPPLYVPPQVLVAPPVETVAAPAPAPTFTPAPPPPQPPRIVYVPQPMPAQQRLPERPIRSGGEDKSSALVYDASVADQPAAATGAATTASDTGGAPTAIASIARARRLPNRATTVAQGTSIPAVLESALDSTRPGPARALVTRNVRSADGSRILIQRGSRLFGDYRANVASGQNRVLITWTQLVRPDGAAVALASPAADPLGRVGVHGSVNTHFLSRFGTALLQSALDVGVNLASRRINSQVIVALPSSTQTGISGSSLGGAGLIGNTQATPTVRVRQGVSISVFVARDLDFTGVEGP